VLSEIASRSGVSIVLDDLGASGSNMLQLIQLNPSFVKLDSELVRDIDHDARKRKAVTGIAHLCSELGAHVIAKGIEREEELRALVECGVAYGQGHLLGRPSSLPAVSKWPGIR
jgi:EAL domain-containing protein (putative c-di-GMP-specific phosphodiesterase class I)